MSTAMPFAWQASSSSNSSAQAVVEVRNLQLGAHVLDQVALLDHGADHRILGFVAVELRLWRLVAHHWDILHLEVSGHTEPRTDFQRNSTTSPLASQSRSITRSPMNRRISTRLRLLIRMVGSRRS